MGDGTDDPRLATDDHSDMQHGSETVERRDLPWWSAPAALAPPAPGPVSDVAAAARRALLDQTDTGRRDAALTQHEEAP
jgi:hypothetical protein